MGDIITISGGTTGPVSTVQNSGSMAQWLISGPIPSFPDRWPERRGTDSEKDTAEALLHARAFPAFHPVSPRPRIPLSTVFPSMGFGALEMQMGVG